MYKGFNITVGIPVYNNYRGLRKCIISAEMGEVKPDLYFIFDNGGLYNNILFKDEMDVSKIRLYRPGYNQGVAKAWNLIIRNTTDIRIICNDDIEFHTDTVKILVDNYDPRYVCYPSSIPINNMFSCFIVSDYLHNLIGGFDENFFPAYFEDNTYAREIELLKNKGVDVGFKGAPCSYEHIGSATLKGYSPGELSLHHKNFEKNKALYLQMWGGLPGEEIFLTKYNK